MHEILKNLHVGSFVLDLGCGEGSFLQCVTAATIVRVDREAPQNQGARQGFVQGDAAALQRAVHSLKGALGNLAAPIGSRLAFELESMGKSGDLGLATTRVDLLEHELIRVIETLEALCLEAAQ